jgi:hypothetical protein
MRDPNDKNNPVVMLPVKYLKEVKWARKDTLSFWHHIDKVRLFRRQTVAWRSLFIVLGKRFSNYTVLVFFKQSILTQIGGPGITEEVALAARLGLLRAFG